MASSLLTIVNNLSERLHRIKCNTDTIEKNVKLAELNTQIVTAFLNTQTLKMI